MLLYDEPVMPTATARKPSQAGRKTRSRLSARRISSRSPLIVAQEDLLEGGRAADERLHAAVDELLQNALQLARLDALDDLLAVQRLGLDRRARQVAKLRERAAFHRPAVADDAHAIAQRLDLGADVAGEQAGAGGLALVLHARAEDLLHQRIEAGRRLVEDQQLGVGGQRGHERALLAVALGVGAALLRGIQLKALDQRVSALRVQAAAQAPEQVDHLAAGQVRPQRHVAGDVRDAPVQGGDVAPRVAAEQARGAAVGAIEAEQNPDRGRLAGAVRPEKSMDLALGHRQIEAVQRARGAEGLDEVADLDGRHTSSVHSIQKLVKVRKGVKSVW